MPDVIDALSRVGKLVEDLFYENKDVYVSVHKLGLKIVVRQISLKGVPYVYSYIVGWPHFKDENIYNYLEHIIKDCINRVEDNIRRDSNATS